MEQNCGGGSAEEGGGGSAMLHLLVTLHVLLHYTYNTMNSLTYVAACNLQVVPALLLLLLLAQPSASQEGAKVKFGAR